MVNYKKLDVLDVKTLKEFNYDDDIYYCGNKSLQKYWTYIYNKAKKLGVPFPFNPACFKHDILYDEIYINDKLSVLGKIKEKFIDDKTFYNDMKRIIENLDCSFDIKKILLRRATLYYSLVIIMTPIYAIQMILRKKNE